MKKQTAEIRQTKHNVM